MTKNNKMDTYLTPLKYPNTSPTLIKSLTANTPSPAPSIVEGRTSRLRASNRSLAVGVFDNLQIWGRFFILNTFHIFLMAVSHLRIQGQLLQAAFCKTFCEVNIFKSFDSTKTTANKNQTINLFFMTFDNKEQSDTPQRSWK